MEAISLGHVLYASWRITWWDANSIGWLLHLWLMTSIDHVLTPDVACDLMVALSLLHTSLILVRKVVVMCNRSELCLRHHIILSSLRCFFVNLDLLGIVCLSSKHELTAHLVALVARSLVGSGITSIFLHLFDPICIPKCVKGVLCARVGWTDVCDHGRSTVASKRVS